MRESNYPNTARGAADAAEVRVMGGIAQNFYGPFTRDNYIKAGLEFIDEFVEVGEREIELLVEELEAGEWEDESRGDYLREIIHEINMLIKHASEIDRDEFARRLGEDYDVQYGH